MIIKNGIILTMNNDNQILKDHSIIIKKEKIIKIVKTSELNDFENHEIIDAKRKIVMPGFISVHTHSIHSLLRGGNEEGKALYEWLEKVVFKGLRKYNPKEVYRAAKLWHKEAIRAGITTFVDSSDFGGLKKIYEPSIKAHEESGMRVIYAAYFYDKNPINSNIPIEDTKKALERIENLMKKYNKSGSLVKVCPSPGETNFVSKRGLLGSLNLAKKYNVPVTLHVSEVKKDSISRGIPAVEYLEKIGFLHEKALLAHCVWVNDKEIDLIKKYNTKVAHNATANGFLADGIMPLSKMKDKKVTIGIGMDDPNCNGNVNMLGNLKAMCLIQKSSTLNPKTITAFEAIKMATIDAAKCIGMEKEIGSIEEGKKADMILIDTHHPNQKPFRNPYFNLVYQCYGNEISHAIINGKLVWQKG